jgi:ribulose-5-phosphate 4-epimerase/fuculose-1-phosphate aldolase
MNDTGRKRTNLAREAEQARIDLAAAYRLAARLNLHEGIDNHFTLMVPGSDQRFLTHTYGMHFSEIRAGDLVEIDGPAMERNEGNVYWAERTAFFIHWSLHKARPDARCIIHLHMPYATALCLLPRAKLEMSFQNALRFHNNIAYVQDYDGIQVAEEQGAILADSVAGTTKRVIFHSHHGIIVLGGSVADAFDDTYYLERACYIQHLAKTYGGELEVVPETVADRVGRQFDAQYADREGYAQKHFDAWKRILNREEADYAK